MKIKAKGLLRHRFWGDYSAHIILMFDCDDASVAIEQLNNNIIFGEFRTASGGMAQSKGWAVSQSSKSYLAGEFNGSDLDKVVEKLVELGADKTKITSMATSIDFGEEFTIEMTIEDKNQMSLELK
jgi:hypothetical protein